MNFLAEYIIKSIICGSREITPFEMNNLKVSKNGDDKLDITSNKKEYSDIDSDENQDSDDSDSQDSTIGGLIANIFGDSDDDEEFDGFEVEDVGSGKTDKGSDEEGNEQIRKSESFTDDLEDESEGELEEVNVEVTSDSDEKGRKKRRKDFVYDFDLMRQKKKEFTRKRKRKDADFINNNDDLIADIIAQMRMAAEEDKELNKKKKAATRKVKLLSIVLSQMKKQDLKMAFLDQDVLNVIAEWLTPLPDRSLPHLLIRQSMLELLLDLPSFDKALLKSSGIGRAVMYLYKHPKETKENKVYAGKLITLWARPIFNIVTDYHSMTKEEREQRGRGCVPKRRKISREEEDKENSPSKHSNARKEADIGKVLTGEINLKPVRPGDKNWIGRAQVPVPSDKDYVKRPKWNVGTKFIMDSEKPLNRMEKHIKSEQKKKRQNKNQRAITVSIEGRRMPL